MSIPVRNVTVVIRSVRERTAAACHELIARQIPPENIVTVSNAPFSATLADSYRAGIERGLPWTLCIDADVLVAPDRIAHLLQRAAEVDASACEIQGLVLDKFFGICRPAGNHLYRTSLLPKALSLIPTEGRDIRPEHFTLSRMAEQGHAWIEVPLVIGLHDFEQFDHDIFRKCCVHARKFDAHMHLLVRYWREMARIDRDFQVALAGMAAGITESSDVRVDIRKDYGFAKWRAHDGWTEKAALNPGELAAEEVERTLNTWRGPGGELERYGACCAREIIHRPTAAPGQPRVAVQGLRLVPYAMGRVLGRAARRLERLAV